MDMQPLVAWPRSLWGGQVWKPRHGGGTSPPAGKGKDDHLLERLQHLDLMIVEHLGAVLFRKGEARRWVDGDHPGCPMWIAFSMAHRAYQGTLVPTTSAPSRRLILLLSKSKLVSAKDNNLAV